MKNNFNQTKVNLFKKELQNKYTVSLNYFRLDKSTKAPDGCAISVYDKKDLIVNIIIKQDYISCNFIKDDKTVSNLYKKIWVWEKPVFNKI